MQFLANIKTAYYLYAIYRKIGDGRVLALRTAIRAVWGK